MSLLVMSPEEEREVEIFEELARRHPESKELIGELSDLIGVIMNQCERIGVERHGAQILQMIQGSRYQYNGCSAPDDETPGDDDRWYYAGPPAATD
jgi:hypothetical protein